MNGYEVVALMSNGEEIAVTVEAADRASALFEFRNQYDPEDGSIVDVNITCQSPSLYREGNISLEE